MDAGEAFGGVSNLRPWQQRPRPATQSRRKRRCEHPPASTQRAPQWPTCLLLATPPTQAATADHHAELARAVAYATGRYLHVMFPENVHQVGGLARG